MISHDESCEVTNDETLASNVLHINGMGGAKIANPFNGVKLQNGAAITFAVKIDAAVAEDGTVADVDLTHLLSHLVQMRRMLLVMISVLTSISLPMVRWFTTSLPSCRV